ncbi:MAG: hypothetical protein WA101_03540 [Minisyncoccia bacterium]
MLDLVIPIIAYGLIFYLFGITVFKWMVVVGLFIGLLAIIYLIAEKSHDFSKIENLLKKTYKKILKFIDEL